MPSDDNPNPESAIPNGSSLLFLENPLRNVMAKSPQHSPDRQWVTLTAHSTDTRDRVRAVAARIGLAGILASYPRFWIWAEWAGLLHDAGKIAERFQLQLRSRKDPWGERHEVLSLAYVDLLAANLSEEDRAMIAAGVVFHHRTLKALDKDYPLGDIEYGGKDWEETFGKQVRPRSRDTLTGWYAAMLGIRVPADSSGRKLWERTRDQFGEAHARWSREIPETDGLVAVLLQGAVTLADRAASAGVELDTVSPIRSGYIGRIAAPYPHQVAAAAITGHLILISPTGSGKTEAGLAWASTQIDAMPGLPRLVWLLPYRASIDAARDRFIDDFGCGEDGIGVLHATAAATLLDRVTCDDRAPGKEDAVKARAMSDAMRLFKQMARVATPHQLLRAAVAGPKYSSVLLEQANSLFVLDELHAYDPVTFGRICAAMILWERLGSRMAIVSATLAPPMISLVRQSLSAPAPVVEAKPGTAPVRHRLAVDPEPLDAPGSLDRIRDWLDEGRSVLVVANRVTVAQKLFDLLDSGDSAVLLHSRFKYGDRATIEKRIRNRHGQRQPGDPVLRNGGLVVSTQCLEVSLCLDFDRGVSELAPVEALAQRAGRVNRLGLHPDGPVEFRVHETESDRPYDGGAVDAARLALAPWDGEPISEQAISSWLSSAYDTEWGRAWEEAARRNRDEFLQRFLTFPKPFADRSEFAEKLDEQFNTVEVLLQSDAAEYEKLISGPNGNPIRAARFLIPVSVTQRAVLGARMDEKLGVLVAEERWNKNYDPRTGLDLSTPPEPSETSCERGSAG